MFVVSNGSSSGSGCFDTIFLDFHPDFFGEEDSQVWRGGKPPNLWGFNDPKLGWKIVAWNRNMENFWMIKILIRI